MGVEREDFTHPLAHGKVAVPRVTRQANGDWSVEFELNFTVSLPDGRRIEVNDRHVMVRGVQRGRKPVATHPGVTELETSAAPRALTALDKIVTVCGACERASCWQGEFYCDYAETAGIKNLTVRELHEKPRGENPEYWFKDADGKIDRPLLEIYQHMTSKNR